jgi:hypothetical protein
MPTSGAEWARSVALPSSVVHPAAIRRSAEAQSVIDRLALQKTRCPTLEPPHGCHTVTRCGGGCIAKPCPEEVPTMASPG